MKVFLLILTCMALPQMSQAAGNLRLHCLSKSAELVFHTYMHGEMAVGDYTAINGQRMDLPNEGKSISAPLDFYNQGRIFRVQALTEEGPMEFTLLAQLFGDPTVLEKGLCEVF